MCYYDGEHMKVKALLISAVLATSLHAMSDSQRTGLIEKMCYHESHNDASAIGDHGKAYGILQIHQGMVDEANRIAGTRFTHDDMFSAAKSKAVAKIVLAYYDSRQGSKLSEKELLFIWNGGGAAWRRVKNPRNDEKQRNLEAYYSRFTSR